MSLPASALRERESTDVHVVVRALFWSAVWLACSFVAVKAYHLGLPSALDLDAIQSYLRSLAAISYWDVSFAVILWASARLTAWAARRRPPVLRALLLGFTALSMFFCCYAVANVVIFGIFGGFLTYPILSLVGDVRMVSSSVGAHVSRGVLLSLVFVPLAYIALTSLTVWLRRSRCASRRLPLVAVALAGVWVLIGHHTLATRWNGRADRRISANAHWVFLTSWWQVVTGDGIVRMPGEFPPGDLADFEAIGSVPMPTPATVVRRASSVISARALASRRPPNVILVVLESVAARWTGLHSGLYETTPMLEAESARSLVFDNFYAHIGRSSNSLVSILLSRYPKLDFRELTEQYPDLPGTSIASVFHDRGYRTAFVTPSDLSWAGWRQFLEGRGFDDVWDFKNLSCASLLSSWGVEDRCMVDAMIQLVEQHQSRPFFLMGWTTQTHDPYEPSPGVPLLDLLRERTPDDWDLGRYLNVVHQTDRQLLRLFDAVRQANLADDTLIVVTGDHGQAFGYPHDTYIQGRTVYEEDVNVPLMFWFPRSYRSTVRAKTVGGHVDLAPTIAALAGVSPGLDWQGRSLLDSRHSNRAYFYVAEDQFRLGVREGNWKYIYDLRAGAEELYDLTRDPTEQRNLAAGERERCARLRQRLVAWTEANRRQYQRIAAPGT